MKDILETIKRMGRGVSANELSELTQIPLEEITRELNERLAAFELITVKDKYVLPSQVGLYVGKVICNLKGFGFLLNDDGDIFISANDMGFAMNGDIVTVRLKPKQKRGQNREGYIVDVISRNTDCVIGKVTRLAGKYRLIPNDAKIQYDIVIDDIGDCVNGDIVVGNIIRYPKKKNGILVKIDKVLGREGDPGIDIQCAIANFNIPSVFKKQSVKQADRIPDCIEEIGNRRDFRQEVTITIDGDNSRDFDDAVSLSTDGDDYILKVHIADVSHYVKRGDCLDKESYQRGNSVYFPASVIPMLPEKLSNGICSLNEGVDRYTLSCIMRIDKNGKVLSEEIVKGVINSNHRMTYKKVNGILAGDTKLIKEYGDIKEMLSAMNSLRKILFAKRVKGGSLEFEIPEASFVLDATGDVVDVTLNHRGESERLIEEFMLLANKTVCKYMINNNLPCVYRVHELPTAEKLDVFCTFIGAYGYKLDRQNITPKKMQSLINKAKGSSIETALSALMLRTLQKARYSAVNHHHFGLAFKDYCHFTSPIRRYADLTVHRILSCHLAGEPVNISNLEEICAHISETEKTAMDAEMKINDLYKCKYLKKHIGEEYDGTVSGMNNSGVYVMLPNTCEGMVRLADIPGDYYVYDERLFQIVGERKRETFRLGDKLKVRITAVNEALGQVDMELLKRI